MNVQVGGGRAAIMVCKYKFVKVPQNNMSCVDMCASAFTEIPDTCMCTASKREPAFIIYQKSQVFKCIDNDKIVIHHVFGGMSFG